MKNIDYIFENFNELNSFLYPLEQNQIKIAQFIIQEFSSKSTEATLIRIKLEGNFGLRFRFDFENEYQIDYSIKEKWSKRGAQLLDSLEPINLFLSKVKSENQYNETEKIDSEKVVNFKELVVFQETLPELVSFLVPKSLEKKCQKILESKEEAKIDRKNEMHQWLEQMNIKNYTILDDLTISINGSVNLSRKNLETFPYAFSVVQGDFDCSYNNLRTLKNSPQIVKGLFNCHSNKLNDLEEGPLFAQSYDCSYNQLKTLKGVPSIIKKDFFCNYNNLINLQGLKKVGQNLFCEDNIISLEKLCDVDVKKIIQCDDMKSLPLEYKKERQVSRDDMTGYIKTEIKNTISGDALKAYKKGVSLDEFLSVEKAKQEKALLDKKIPLQKKLKPIIKL